MAPLSSAGRFVVNSDEYHAAAEVDALLLGPESSGARVLVFNIFDELRERGERGTR